MQKRRCTHERNLLIGKIISDILINSQYFSDENLIFNLPNQSFNVMIGCGRFREE